MLRRFLNAVFSVSRQPSAAVHVDQRPPTAAGVDCRQAHDPSKRVGSSCWAKRGRRINHPKSVEWDLEISDTDVTKILDGFAPRQMEDRWKVCPDGPDDMGNIVSHMCRSWTGFEMYRLKITAPRFGGSGSGTACAAAEVGEDDVNQARITEFIWESRVHDGFCELNIGEKEAKRSAIGICRGFLGCKLENAPEVVGWDSA